MDDQIHDSGPGRSQQDGASWLSAAGPVRRFLSRLVGPQRAEDLASDTMLSLLQSASPASVRKPVSFALRVAWNKAVDSARRDQRRPDHPDPDAVARASAPDAARVAELRDWIDFGLGRLRPDERRLLTMRYEEDRSYREIARALGVPAGTVGRRLHDARRRLAEALRAADDGRGLPLVLAFLPALRRDVTSLADVFGGAEGATAGSSVPTLLGVLVMSKKLVAACIVLLVIGAGAVWWLVASEGGARGSDSLHPAEPPAASNASALPVSTPTTAAPIVARPAAEHDPSLGVAPVLRGRVVGEDGRPVAGARVTVAARAGAVPFDLDDLPAEGSRRTVVTADGDGAFLADVAALGCLFDVAATAPGFAPAITDLVGLSGPPLELVLRRGAPVSVLVRDLAGAPIAGASVTFRGLAGVARLRIAATTDAGGRCRLGPLPDAAALTLGMAAVGSGPSTGEAHVLVEADGFAPQRTGIPPPGSPLEVNMARGAIVSGVVRDAVTGGPIADAEVVLWTLEGLQGVRFDRGLRLRNPFGSRIIARSKTDASGFYRFEHVPAPVAGIRMLAAASFGGGMGGRMRLGGVAAWRLGHAPAGGEVRTALADGEAQTVDLALNPAGVVTGRVVDDAGNPVAGARVFCLAEGKAVHGVAPPIGGLVPGEAGPFGGAATSDADGRFRHDAVPLTRDGVVVYAYACGCDVGLGNSERVNVAVTPGAEVAIRDLVMDGGGRIVVRGFVRDVRGGPIAGAVIAWGAKGPVAGSVPAAQAITPAQSDNLGAFEIAVPQPGREPKLPALPGAPPPERVLSVSARGRVTRVVPLPARAEPLVVVLSDAATIAGVVVETDGTPVEGADVRALPASMADAEARDVLAAASVAAAKSAGGGAFALDAPADPVVVVAWVPGEGLRLGRLGPTSGPVAGVRVVMPPKPPKSGATLLVRVTDAETGTPWKAAMSGSLDKPGAAATPRIGPFFGPTATVAGPGDLRFERVPAGTYVLRVSAPGFGPAVVEGVVIEDGVAPRPIEVRLGAGGVIEGAVALPGGVAGLADVTVRCVDASGRPVETHSAADGSFRVRGLAAGTWIVTASRILPKEKLVTTEALAIEVGDRPAFARLVLAHAVATRIYVARSRSPVADVPPRSGAVVTVTIEDASARVLATTVATPKDDPDPTTLYCAQGPVKVVVRRGAATLATADGIAGADFRLDVPD